jgi:hypothetical protein
MANGIIRLDEGWRLDEGHRFDEPPYVPPPAPPPVLPTKKGKAMDFVPQKRDSRYAWLQNLSTNVVAEAVKFGGVSGDATAVKAAADNLIAKMNATNAAEATLKGARTTEATAQAADIAAIRAKVRNWKTLTGWAASGSEGVLQLKGTQPAFDPESYKPAIKVSIEGGKIRIDFKKLGVDALAIYCRLRGTAVWRKIGVDTEAPYFDTAPLANPAVSEVREYLARGVVGDEEIGLDSDIVSIAFAG